MGANAVIASDVGSVSDLSHYRSVPLVSHHGAADRRQLPTQLRRLRFGSLAVH